MLSFAGRNWGGGAITQRYADSMVKDWLEGSIPLRGDSVQHLFYLTSLVTMDRQDEVLLPLENLIAQYTGRPKL